MLQLNYILISSKELSKADRIRLACRGEDFGAILSDGVLKVNKDLKKPKKLEKIVPLPMISLTAPITVSASVKPRPIPIPSNAESRALFLLANISALPRMIQFTTIRGRNTPSEL